MNGYSDTTVIRDNFLNLRGDDFFSYVQQLSGETVCEILKIQSIDSVETLINCADLLDIFRYNSPEINCLRNKIYFKTYNGNYILKAGVKINMRRLPKLIDGKIKEQKKLTFNQEHDEISIDVINNNLLLKSLSQWYQFNEGLENSKPVFLTHFIECIVNNLHKSPNNYRYSSLVEQFALALYIMGGKMTYDFVRVNLSPSLPSIQTLNQIMSKQDWKINEGEFLFDKLHDYLARIGVQYAFAAEDCTAVVQRISYDQKANVFIGFALPLVNGIPVTKYYRTDSFDQLKSWFNSADKSTLLNVHMVQPLQSSNKLAIPSPFLLSTYGVVNTFTSIDILRRWLFIFDNCIQKNIRIIGFSTDGDAKYLRAMRLASEFFASLPYFRLNERQTAFDLTTIIGKWSWFFLKGRQLLLFLQDPIHLVTKWRNRLLTSTAQLCIGQRDISIEHLFDIIENPNYSKLDHGLTRSDLNPKDRQNFNSCIKISSNDVLSILMFNAHTYATFLYLHLLNKIILTYIEKRTTIEQR